MALSEMAQNDEHSNGSVAVIGAGVVGLCCALEAQRKGYQVTLFDRDEVGLGASFGNAGYLATELIEPLSNPQTLRSALSLWLNPKGPLFLPLQYLTRIIPWLFRFVGASAIETLQRSRKGLIQLNREAIAAWQRCLTDIDATEQIIKSGYLLVWESADKIEAARQHQAWLRDNSIDAELVQGERLAQLEPELAKTVSHALFFPDACRVREPYLLCTRLFSAFIERGGVFIQQSVTQVRPSGRQVTVFTEPQDYRYDTAMICAGAWSKTLLSDMGINVPLEAERGYHLTIPEAGFMLRHTIGSAERRFVMGPLESGLRVVGMTELGGLKLHPFKQRFDVLRYHSRQLLPGLNTPELEVSEWMGHRPTLPDSLPVIDQHPQHPQILFAFGNQHLGLTQAAVTAELTLKLLQKEVSMIDMSLFKVNRF
ncbi:NAD(P)/FAD-dependent oxidoreductase [Amphritea pacifica]|uniref:NAD(P)/FAD-dependent oxidoreductase n=1 Tax=Amphritea pacifica TaxID=2811233 RepID=UPI0019658C7B|nr:FAD-dependent oxidoreductase [Amphritea pacifica]MBN1005768.1 FAD-binding oxidoreductase [Amphritea pacifica]